MKRSPAVIPITCVIEKEDEFGDMWIETKEIGRVHTDDMLELLNGMDKIWVDIKR